MLVDEGNFKLGRGGGRDQWEVRLQSLELSDIVLNDSRRARRAVMIPSATVADLQAPVSPLKPVGCVCLAVVSPLGFIDLDTAQERSNSGH